jgi:hypothetical protein
MTCLNIWIIRITVCMETSDTDLRWRYWHVGNHDHYIRWQLSDKIKISKKRRFFC